MPFKNDADRKENLRLYHLKNREKRLAIEKERYRQKTEFIKARCAGYRAKNKDKVYEWNGSRRAALRRALPKWVLRREIKDFYDCARELTKLTGTKYHVDHIIPLAHASVCGLHVPYNLAVVMAADNMRKGNKFDHAEHQYGARISAAAE